MTSPPSFSFSKPAMPGDAVSVTVLVEDSPAMAARWPDIRDAYLPNLLDNLRAADPSAEMEARWLTTSSASSAPSFPITDTAEARSVPELPLNTSGIVKLSPAIITNAISTLSSTTRQQNTTRHLILVAATGPSTTGLNDATPSGFDTWDDIAMVLKQQYIRLHVILSIGAEMRTYHELFKRSLQLQNNSEVPAWFPVDSRRYSIRLSGRPQYVRGSGAVPIALVSTAIPEDPFNNPSPGSSPEAASPQATTPSPSSPIQPTSPGSRKLPHSPTTPRTRPRAPDSPQSPPASEGGGLVSYLQQMHGLTKKKSYGIKAPKKTYADIRLPGSGRPILPRLEVPQPQSDLYAYPTFDNGPASEIRAPSSEPQIPPPRRHSVDQLPASSLVARTSNEDRRARRRGPWLPIAPLVSSTPSSPATATSPGTLAALQSLASMTPRLPDFVTKERMASSVPTDHRPVYLMTASAVPMTSDPHPSAAYYASNASAWSQHGSAVSSSSPISSPTHALSPVYQTSPPTPSLVGSDYAYSNSPPSSAASTPASLCAPANDSGDDQPFIVTPEYEATVNARFDEAVRSGAMQASMTPAIHSAVPSLSSPSYAPSIPAPVHQEQFYPALSQTQPHQAMSHQGETGYPMYSVAGHQSDYLSSGTAAQANAAWIQYDYAGNAYMAPVSGYSPPQGHWYPA
ncbi:hypothetical protein DICSQDRAFT_161239 [Dichomitus squalens LYAD-421 SS1]|uniref:Uncharacterized protein n=1 Tax=Dichomitus squalens (strain LYAD-421) TaxID=732165 RepID=R7T2R3_DICSQ|nr:uncharacterized protein DICSQDRAFT_161239 [Dichomitus squalens LYAD-421 SS1]EJF61907.1 hypothetical protein DICSQDRAFT_161239 [Dichomitus squalens LYAD-421 SS1]